MNPAGPPLGRGCWAVTGMGDPDGAELDAETSDDTTARKVCASLVASAFFKYTTCTLPGYSVGRSSFAISDFARLARASDGARTMIELLRGSASRLMRPASPPGLAAPGSSKRLTITAISLAIA